MFLRLIPEAGEDESELVIQPSAPLTAIQVIINGYGEDKHKGLQKLITFFVELKH